MLCSHHNKLNDHLTIHLNGKHSQSGCDHFFVILCVCYIYIQEHVEFIQRFYFLCVRMEGRHVCTAGGENFYQCGSAGAFLPWHSPSPFFTLTSPCHSCCRLLEKSQTEAPWCLQLIQWILICVLPHSEWESEQCDFKMGYDLLAHRYLTGMRTHGVCRVFRHEARSRQVSSRLAYLAWLMTTREAQ